MLCLLDLSLKNVSMKDVPIVSTGKPRFESHTCCRMSVSVARASSSTLSSCGLRNTNGSAIVSELDLLRRQGRLARVTEHRSLVGAYFHSGQTFDELRQRKFTQRHLCSSRRSIHPTQAGCFAVAARSGRCDFCSFLGCAQITPYLLIAPGGRPALA